MRGRAGKAQLRVYGSATIQGATETYAGEVERLNLLVLISVPKRFREYPEQADVGWFAYYSAALSRLSAPALKATFSLFAKCDNWPSKCR